MDVKPDSTTSGKIESVDDYHQRTRHTAGRYAAGPEALDWSMQPDPFRKFEGCEQRQLSLGAESITTSFQQVSGTASIPGQAFTLEMVGILLEMSLAISSWKQYGPDRWALRCNPSSGNLHPTEAYLVNWDEKITVPGIYHYRCDKHCLETRSVSQTINGVIPANDNPGGFVIGLSSVYWREAWKYGERAYRYCQLDIGHAFAAISYAAKSLGWHAYYLDSIADSAISDLLGLGQAQSFNDVEKESPDMLVYIGNPGVKTERVNGLINKLAEHFKSAAWSGEANRLDNHPMYQWPVIDDVSVLACKPATTPLFKEHETVSVNTSTQPGHPVKASMLFKQRRSAQAFDNSAVMSRQEFIQVIEKLLPGDYCPWNSTAMPDYVHPVFYLHRVEGLKPGLYVLPRSTQGFEKLKKNMRSEFRWEAVDDCPAGMPFYELVTANSQNAARTVSCHQDIASDGAFCVSMLAEYDTAIEQGEWYYRYLHWQAGMLGHILYLEAESINMRGTGIGCFFDGTVHQLLGIESTQLQVIYHFTVGYPVVDQRLISLPPYSHLSGNIQMNG